MLMDLNEVSIPRRIKGIYDSCTDEEKYYLRKILEELADSDIGYSKTYQDIWLADYKEIPVDIDTFISADMYLGRTNRNGEAVFPFWRKELRNFFGAGNQFWEWVLTGATRIGKSSTANTGLSYMLYRLMCLRDPQKFFGKKDVSIFSILFFNLTEKLAKGVAFREYNDTLKESPWFVAHGSFTRSDQNFIYIPEGGKITIDYGSDASHGLGKQVFAAMLDEINFSQAGIKDVNKAKTRIKNTYDTINARIQGTFKHGGQVFGKMFAVSSKRSDSDFMEDHIRTMRDSGGDAHMYVSDAPQWEVLPPETFSPERFTIAVGGQHQKSFVVPEQQDFPEALHDLEQQGFLILHPPIDMRANFKADFNVALRDLAGISVAGAMSFITQESITQCINTERRNPFYSDILQIGTQDTYTIAEFFHQEEVPAIYKAIPIFIHLDLALVNDRAGISGVGVIGRTDVKMDDDKIVSVPKVGHMFSVAIEAPRGDRIAFGKIVAFIRWLRKVGYNIFLVSRDQFQSDYLAEELESQGFKTAKFSLDRTPDGYITLQAILLEKRIDLLYSELLQTELIHLQKDNVTNKVDHPVGGCFTANTKIILADGRSLTIAELLIEQTYRQNTVYTVNRKFRYIENKPIKKVFCTKIVTELTRLTLDDGSVIECTHDHRFLCTDMMYVEAHNLTVGQSLLSLSQQKSVKSVERIEKSCLVYDLEIEENHNFALAAGVFVHNSKDLSDSLAGAVFQCLQESPGTTVSAKHRASAIAAVNSGRGSMTHAIGSTAQSRFPIPGRTNRK